MNPGIFISDFHFAYQHNNSYSYYSKVVSYVTKLTKNSMYMHVHVYNRITYIYIYIQVYDSYSLVAAPQSTQNWYSNLNGKIVYMYIKTHGSESRGQEAAVHDERVSYLQVAPLKNSQLL